MTQTDRDRVEQIVFEALEESDVEKESIDPDDIVNGASSGASKYLTRETL